MENKTTMRREAKNQAKRESILQAALDIFSAKGFAAARVEDIARAAGVGKGTIYLHFTDKDHIFAALVEDVLTPVHKASIAVLEDNSLSLRERLWRMAQPFVENNGISRLSKTIRLVQAEGLHNPHLVRHYRENIVHTSAELEQRMREHGMAEELCAFPQLLIGPLLYGITWQGLLGDRAPLDIAAMYRTHLDRMLGE